MARNSNQNRDNQDQDSDLENDRPADSDAKSRFSVASLTRFAAVAFFVVLGTGAVIYSMTSKPNAGDEGQPKGLLLASVQGKQAAGEGDVQLAGDSGKAGQTAEASESPQQDRADKDKGSKIKASDVSMIADLGLSAVSAMVELPEASSSPKTNNVLQASTTPPPIQTAKPEPVVRRQVASNSFPKPKTEPEAFKKPEVQESGFTPPVSSSPKVNNLLGKDPIQKPRFADLPKLNPETNKTKVPPVKSGTLIARPDPSKRSFSPGAAPLPKTEAPPADRYASKGPLYSSQGGFQKADPNPGNLLSQGRQKTGAPKLPEEINKGAGPLANSLDRVSENASAAANDIAGRMKDRLANPVVPPNRLASPNTLGANAAPGSGAFTPPPLRGRPATIADPTNSSKPGGVLSANDQRNSISQAKSGNLLGAPPMVTAKPNSSRPRQQPKPQAFPATAIAVPTGPSQFPAAGLNAKGALPERNASVDTRVRSKAPEISNSIAPPTQSFSPSTPGRLSNKASSGPRGSALVASPVKSNVTPPAKLPSFGSSRPMASSNAIASNSPIGLMDVPGERSLEGNQTPAISLQMLAPREVQVNQTAEFQIVVRNVGRTIVDDIKVFDRVPAGAEFEGASPKPDANQSGNLRWDLGSLRPGAEKRIAMKLKPIRPGEIGSVAQYTFAAKAGMRTRVTKPVLEITHSSKPTAMIGDDVFIDVVVKNKGDGPAKNVLIQEDIPQQLAFRDNYREIEYAIGTLMPGQSKSARLALKAVKPGKIKNVMYASADGGLQANHAIDMEIVSPRLKVSSDGPTFRYLGRKVTHEIQLANQGTAAATNVELIARLPGGVKYVASNNQGTYNPNNHAVYWSLARLEKNVNAGVELTTMPMNIGNHPIKIETFADLGLRHNTEQALSIEHKVDVFFSIDDLVDPIEIGGETQYRVLIENQGTKVATNVKLAMGFPNGIKPLSVKGPLAHNVVGQQIQFQPIGSLKPGDKLSFIVVAQGQAEGDHRVAIQLQSDDRPNPVKKEESTHVYSDR